MPEWLSHLFSQYGYALIVVATLLENAGIPAPGHTVLLAAGVLAQRQQLSLVWVIIAGALAAVVGDNIGYWIGRKRGRGFLKRHGRRFHLSEARLKAIEEFYARHGNKTVFIARFVTGLQTVAALFAGVSRMPWRNFFFYNLTGAFSWATVYALLGYAFGKSWAILENWVGHAGLLLLLIVMLVFLLTVGLRRGRKVAASAGEYLRIVLVSRGTLLFLAAFAALGVFVKISEDVVTHESSGFDRAASLGLHRLDSPFMDVTMRFFTVIGSFPVVMLVAATVLFLCYRRRDLPDFKALLIVAVADELLNALLKQAFGRPRPNLFSEIATLHTYSFPSGHAMAATAIYGMTAVVIARLYPRLRRVVALGTPPIVILIGLSRVFLGVHWATDVLAGFAAGGFLLVGGIYLLGPQDHTVSPPKEAPR